MCVCPLCAQSEEQGMLEGRFLVVDGGWDMCVSVCVCLHAGEG